MKKTISKKNGVRFTRSKTEMAVGNLGGGVFVGEQFYSYGSDEQQEWGGQNYFIKPWLLLDYL